jgi:hypothetical protein
MSRIQEANATALEKKERDLVVSQGQCVRLKVREMDLEDSLSKVDEEDLRLHAQEVVVTRKSELLPHELNGSKQHGFEKVRHCRLQPDVARVRRQRPV